jgi:hypothetical protein
MAAVKICKRFYVAVIKAEESGTNGHIEAVAVII